MNARISRERRRLLRITAGLLVAALALATLNGLSAQNDAGAATGATAANDASDIRLLTVGAATTGGLLDDLVADFEAQSGHEVIVSVGTQDIFDQARAGAADIVLAHWGFTELERFVSEGSGRWPATVLSNTVVFLVPHSDPANVKRADDPVEAFRRIAKLESPFVVNELGETRYISDTLWNAVGRPDKEGWFLELGLSGPAAVREAERRGGYTLWGLHPFLMLQRQQPLNLEPVILNDSLMQRIIASVVVIQAPDTGNEEGAVALQEFLIDPATQAKVRSFRLPDLDRPIFWPAGNNNDN